MAISPVVDWIVRPSGSTDNGGGFKVGASGTDYSDQDSAQASYTTLAMASTGTTLTSTAEFGTVGSAIVGNVIKITGGTNFTTGWYEVTGYTDTNTITIDRNATNGSAASSGTGNMGGALHIDNLHSSAFMESTDVWNFAGDDNITVYIKTGTHTVTDSLNPGQLVTTTTGHDKWQVIRGFDTTKGEAVEGATRPLINKGDNDTYWNTNNVALLDCRFAAAVSETIRAGSYWSVRNCSFTNTLASGTTYAFRSNGEGTFLSCEFTCDASANGFGLSNNNLGLTAKCYFKNCKGDATERGVVVDCIFDGCGVGFDANIARSYCINSIFYSCTTGVQMAADRTSAINCIFSDCTTGISVTTNNAAQFPIEPNLFYNNTNNFATGDDDHIRYSSGTNTWTNKTADPSFENASSSDFTVSSTGGAKDFGLKFLAGE